jgi:alanine racemase
LNDAPSPSRDSAAAVPPVEAGGLLTIDLGALASNWRRLKARAGSAECAAVVKADAYGIGIEAAVPALAKAGCRTFFVAQLSEAIRARGAAPAATIYVLNGLIPGTAGTNARFDLRPVLGSREEIDEWSGFCRAQGLRLPASVHVDTGMHRLGLRIEEGLALQGDGRLADFSPTLLMSHFVASEDFGHPANARQIEAFDAVRQALPDLPASLSNSSGIHLPSGPHHDMVRPGYALYGGNPTPGRDNPMAAVVRLEARIVQVRTVEDGETVGYGGEWTARGRRRVATLSVGYADGYPRAASRTERKTASGVAAGEALVAGIRCPFAGRVSMDLIALDVTGVPAERIGRGALVTLIGDGLTLDEVASRAGTIGYEILTSLGRRYARIYVGDAG